MAFARTVAHATASDTTFSAAGAAAWNGTAAHTPAVSGATSGGIPYFDSATSEASSGVLTAGRVVLGGGAGAAPNDDSNLAFDGTNKRLSIGSGSTTVAGLIVGHGADSGFGAIYSTSVTPSTTNFALYHDGQNTILNAPSGGALRFRNANVTKMSILSNSAGSGVEITAGTAASDLQAIDASQVWNSAGVTFTAYKFKVTDTASAAGSLAVQFLGGAAGTTNLFKVSKAGNATAPSFTPEAGTTAIAPVVFTSGTNLTTAAAGAQEFDGTCFYATAAASSRQVVDCEQIAILDATFQLANSNTAQNWLPAANDTLTLAASTTYEFEAFMEIEGMGTGNHTTSTLFAGTATFTSINYWSMSWNGTAAAAAASQVTKVNQVATAVVIQPTHANASQTHILRGTMRINGAGTLIPQLTFSVDPTGTIVMAVDSFFRIWPVGSNTVAAVGNWA